MTNHNPKKHNNPASPKIDAETFMHPGTLTPETLQQIALAVQRDSFLSLQNCPDASNSLTETLRQMDYFFGLPDAHPTKQAALVRGDADSFGWTPALGEPAYEPGTIAHVESFDCGRTADYAMNWPDVPGFRHAVTQYQGWAFALGNRLLAALAIHLDLDDSFFVDRCASQELNTLRLLHYPANCHPADEINMGISAHTDFECITLIYQSAPGLEIQNASGEWHLAPFGKDRISVLMGDMMERWTNGRIRATRHRIRNEHFGRKSIVLFMAVDPEIVVEPLPSFASDMKRVYEPITQERHLYDSIARAKANALTQSE